MAEVDSSVYRSLGQNNDPLKQPLAIMQLLGAVNQNKLQNMEIGSRQGVSDAYANNPSPDLATLGRAAGPNAPVVLNQAIQNQQLQNALYQAQQDTVQKRIGAIAATLGPKASITDYTRAIVQAASDNKTIPTEMWTKRLDEANKIAKDPKALHQWGISQGTTAPGFDAIGGEAGPVNDQGVSPQVTKAEAAIRRSGAAPDQNKTGMVTTNAPGFEKVAGAGAEAYSNAINRAGSYGQDIYPLEKALEGIQKLPPGSTGPGKDEVNTAKSFLVANLPFLPGVDKIDIDKIKDYDETKKYFLQMAGAASSRFGHGTDQALSTALSASPSTGISQLAATELTKANIALRRMEQVQALQASDPQASGIDFSQNPSKYPAWASKWVTNVDPRAFMFDKLDDKQRDTVLKSIKTKEQKDKFNRSYHMGIQSGVMADPNAAQ